MKSTAGIYFLPLLTLPTILTGPGCYITRRGDTVTVEVASSRNDFRCWGQYASGVAEGWHRTGRILATSETANDIIRAA